MSIKRVFLGTSSSLPELAARRLTANCGKLPDFGRIIFAVPGNYAKSAFQDTLVSLVPDGLFEPQIMTPGILMHCGTEKKNLPSKLENELIWNKTARNAAKSGEFDLLFPGYHDGTNISGSAFSHLRLELTAGGFSICDAKEHLGSRGEQLAKLEQLYLEELSSCGFDDSLDADIQAVENTEYFAGIDKIILCGLVDLPRLLKKRIENTAARYPGKVEAWIYADSSKADFFDNTGCAIPEKWNNCLIDIADFENRVHSTETFDDAARKLTELFEAQGDLIFEETAVVLADNSMFPVFKRKLANWAKKHGGELDLYDPSGIPVSELRIHKLLLSLQEFCKNKDDIDTALMLIKNSDFLAYLAGRFHKRTTTLLKELDEFLLRVLPTEISNAVSYFADNQDKYQQVNEILSYLDEIYGEYQKLPIAVFLKNFLTEIYKKRKSSELSPYRDVPFPQECALIQDHLENLEKLNIDSFVSKDEIFELFCKQLGEEKLSTIPTANSIAIQGCLELPFLHEKNIFFCGVSASHYPDVIAPVLYLTDTIRRKIGIRSNQETFARAASHLHSLCQTAHENTNMHFITTKRDKSGEPLSPSPLFFTGNLSEQELFKRCRKFFDASETCHYEPEKWKSEHSYFSLAPQLDYRTHKDYPDVPVLSVTAFEAYIKNPLEFFLDRIMHMSKIDYSAKEPDAMTFGNLVHETFHKFGTTVCHTEEEYKKQLLACLRDVMQSEYGKNPSALLEVIRDNISQRLEHAAAFMLESSKKHHFVPIETEFELGGEEKMIACRITNGETPDVFIKGIIDRIEYCAERNLIRIVDFKTSSLKNIKEKITPYNSKKTEIKLTDLQMPLYADLLKMDENFKSRHPEIDMDNVKIECAYFVLPKTVTDTRILVWEESELLPVIDFAWLKVCDIVNELKKWKNQEMSEKGNKCKNYSELFLPDVPSCLKNVHWITSIPEKYPCK